MNNYELRYLSGPQHQLVYGPKELVRANSLAEALASKSPWPVETDLNKTSAWAKNPGTSLYYVEAWEARLING